MNRQQRQMLQVVLVILGCFGIYVYTALQPVTHVCAWTGLEIVGRGGHEVVFSFENGSVRYYACINVSVLAFRHLVATHEVDRLVIIKVRCVECGMVMGWDDPMVVWIYQPEYLCPTTSTPTIVAACRGLCEQHFLERYGGTVVPCPYVWPE